LDYWKVAASPLGIVITVRGHDKERTFEAAIPIFHQLVSMQEGSFSVIGDLRETLGYETAARVAWQAAFFQHRKRIARIVVIGNSTPLVRMGVAVLASFTGIPVRFVGSWSEVTEAIP
jgi:hypothetical protein